MGVEDTVLMGGIIGVELVLVLTSAAFLVVVSVL
jgi:hypothetical protein